MYKYQKPDFSDIVTDKLCTNCPLHIPKIIHRIWTVWDPNAPKMPKTYEDFDLILKKLHPDWTIMEWDDSKILAFIKEHYPNFLPTYLSYDQAVKRHDVSRYLIINHFGGVFIQHSVMLKKSFEPLLLGSDLIVTEQITNSIWNGFIASIPHHPFWQNLIDTLPQKTKLHVLKATGPKILTKTLYGYLKNTKDPTIKILDHKYLLPFSWKQGDIAIIKSNCLQQQSGCFELFPEAYGFCLWKGSWGRIYRK